MAKRNRFEVYLRSARNEVNRQSILRSVPAIWLWQVQKSVVYFIFPPIPKKVPKDERSREASWLHCPALRPTDLGDLETLARAHLAQDAVNVILDSLLGKAELCRDFLVCQAASDQGNQLLFPSG